MSSTKWCILQFLIELCMSFMHRINKRGPRAELCGTLQDIVFSDNLLSLIWLSDLNLSIWSNLLYSPSLNFYSRFGVQTDIWNSGKLKTIFLWFCQELDWCGCIPINTHAYIYLCTCCTCVTHWAIPEKKNKWVEGMLFWKLLKFLGFTLFTSGNSWQNKASPLGTQQNCVTTLLKF